MVTGADLIPTASQLGASLIAGVCTSSITRSGALSRIEDTSLESSTQVTVIPGSHSSSEQMSLRPTASGSDTKTRIGSVCIRGDNLVSVSCISMKGLTGFSPPRRQYLSAWAVRRIASILAFFPISATAATVCPRRHAWKSLMTTSCVITKRSAFLGAFLQNSGDEFKSVFVPQ